MDPDVKEGAECPVHKRVHGSHGWYVCEPEASDGVERDPTTPLILRCPQCSFEWVGLYIPQTAKVFAKMCRRAYCPRCGDTHPVIPFEGPEGVAINWTQRKAELT